MKVRNIYIVFSILMMMFIVGQPVMGEKEKEKRKAPPDSPKDVSPLKVGEQIPDTTLLALNEESFNLGEVVKDKPAILIFYRGNW